MGRAYYLTTLADWLGHAARFTSSHWIAADPSAPVGGASHILVVVEADEAAHLALEQHPGFEPLPHPLSAKPVSARVADTLAGRGVPAGATTFDAAEFLSRAHPLLRHRVF